MDEQVIDAAGAAVMVGAEAGLSVVGLLPGAELPAELVVGLVVEPGVEFVGGPLGDDVDVGDCGVPVVGGAVVETGAHTTVNSAVAVPSAYCVGPPLHVKLAVKCPGRLPARP